MEMEGMMELAEKRLQAIVKENVDPRDRLVEISRYVLQVTELDRPCFAYIVPLENLGLESKRFVVAVFLKSQEHRRMAVFDSGTSSEKTALAFGKERLSHFSYYLFSSCFLCDPVWACH